LNGRGFTSTCVLNFAVSTHMLTWVSQLLGIPIFPMFVLNGSTQMLISASYCYRVARMVFNYNMTDIIRKLDTAKKKFIMSEGTPTDIDNWHKAHDDAICNWWVRKRHWISQRRLVSIGVVDLTICLIIVVSTGVATGEPFITVKMADSIQLVLTMFSIPHNLFALIMGCIACGFSNDSLKIKRELKMIGVIAVIGTIGIPVVGLTGDMTDLYNIPFFFTMLVMILIVVAVIIMPIVDSFRHEKYIASMSADNLMEYLQQPHIRDEFCSFLTNEFSIENLEFYETITSIRSSSHLTHASINFIMITFIDEGSMKQINISSNTTSNIFAAYRNIDTIPTPQQLEKVITELLVASEEVMSLMKKDSFPRFIHNSITHTYDSQVSIKNMVHTIQSKILVSPIVLTRSLAHHIVMDINIPIGRWVSKGSEPSTPALVDITGEGKPTPKIHIFNSIGIAMDSSDRTVDTNVNHP